MSYVIQWRPKKDNGDWLFFARYDDYAKAELRLYKLKERYYGEGTEALVRGQNLSLYYDYRLVSESQDNP